MRQLAIFPMFTAVLFCIMLSACTNASCYRCTAIDPAGQADQFFQDHCDEATQDEFEDQFRIDHAGYDIECRKH